MNKVLQQFSSNLPTIATVALVLVLVLFFVLIFCIIQLRSARQRIARRGRQIHKLEVNATRLQEESTAEKIRSARLVTLLKNEKKHTAEKLAILDDAREKMRLQFHDLAQRILDEKSQKFSQDNRDKLTALLQPFQEQLRTFQQRIDDIQVNDIRERSSLKKEIAHLRDLNQKINEEAVNLSRALKGDKKIQGNWGELVLERVLEHSGLRKGQEYSVQGGFRDSDNRLLKPDVIIHLPESKDIIIDSKVSLIAWSKYINSENSEKKNLYLQEHIQAIRSHIDGLSSKNYSDLKGLNSLDFVLLFIPIESSFHVACDLDDNLFTYGFDHRIVVVTPTTLLTSLKTIENLWRFERQNQNAKEIADRAGSIYDKLRGFVEDMEKMGKQLVSTSATYDSAMNRLVRGRGNVISQAGKLTELGVKVKKEIPRSIRDSAEPEIPN